MSEILFRLAGLRFALASSGADAPALPPTYDPFLDVDGGGSSPIAGRYRVTSAGEELPAATQGAAARLWESFIWRLGKTGGDQRLLEVRELPSDTYLRAAVLSEDFAQGILATRRRPPLAACTLNYPEDQIILLNRLSFFQAGLVHASGVVVDGRAFIFCGRSGAGKTTIERLWKAAGYRLLNDDRIIVRLIDGRPFACSTPWHGEDPEVHAEDHPLGAVFHLNQAADNRLVPISGAAAVARLYATSLAPFYLREGTARLLAAYEAILSSVPSFDLFFTPDRRAVDLCLHTLPHPSS